MTTAPPVGSAVVQRRDHGVELVHAGRHRQDSGSTGPRCRTCQDVVASASPTTFDRARCNRRAAVEPSHRVRRPPRPRTGRRRSPGASASATSSRCAGSVRVIVTATDGPPQLPMSSMVSGTRCLRQPALLHQVLHDEAVGLMEDVRVDLVHGTTGKRKCIADQRRHARQREVEDACAVHLQKHVSRGSAGRAVAKSHRPG